jgi:hypothetical protein
MYWPWSRRLAWRAGESFSFLRPEPREGTGSRPMPPSVGARRASARTIDASDLRIDWRSLPIDARRGLGTPRLHRERSGRIVLCGDGEVSSLECHSATNSGVPS